MPGPKKTGKVASTGIPLKVPFRDLIGVAFRVPLRSLYEGSFKGLKMPKDSFGGGGGVLQKVP